jgi:hypothetical protein
LGANNNTQREPLWEDRNPQRDFYGGSRFYEGRNLQREDALWESLEEIGRNAQSEDALWESLQKLGRKEQSEDARWDSLENRNAWKERREWERRQSPYPMLRW